MADWMEVRAALSRSVGDDGILAQEAARKSVILLPLPPRSTLLLDTVDARVAFTDDGREIIDDGMNDDDSTIDPKTCSSTRSSTAG